MEKIGRESILGLTSRFLEANLKYMLKKVFIIFNFLKEKISF